MSTITTAEYKSDEELTSVTTCIKLDKPIKYNLARLAVLKHTSVSHLLNAAAEDYLRRYVESESDIQKKIRIK